MLFDLPSDLSLSILQDWLADLKCLAALDAASAPSVRSDYLALVAQPAFLLSSTIVMDPNKSPTRMFYWINTRDIKLSALECDTSMLKQCAEISYLCLRTVRKLKIFSRPGGNHNGFESEWLQRLLRLLPQLRVVDMGDFQPVVNTEYLADLSSSASSLTEILLDNSSPSCNGIIPLIKALGSTVIVANFGDARVLDTPTLNLIALTCKHIEALYLTCELNSSQDFVSIFASGCFAVLKRLHMACDGPQLNEEMVKAIFHQHPLLNDVDLRPSVISPKTCADTISSNSRVVNFVCTGFSFDVESDSELTYSKLIFRVIDGDPYPSQTYRECILQLVSSCLYPIEYFECLDPYLNNEDLLAVVSVLGKDLKSFITDLNGTDDDDNIVQQITLLCPRLEVLYLNSTTSVTDLSLKAIANNCKFLIELSLHEGELITDIGMCYLLYKIVCSNLKVLEINVTDIPVEHIKGYLLASSENRLPNLEKLVVDTGAFGVLMNFVTNAENVDKKWTKLLERCEG